MTSIGSKSPLDETSFSSLKKCKCGSMLRVQTAETSKNFGRRFISCLNTWGGIGGCKFFRWVDSKKASPQLDNETTFGEVKKSSIQFHPSLERMKIELQEVNKELHISSEIMIKHLFAIRNYAFIICILLVVIIIKMFV
ncbi:hypothetical protein ACFE04_001265 [Oxalis oulophora]